MKIVKMNKIAHAIGEDELYCEFFQCPKCGNEMVMQGAKFCSKCGRKINWIEHKADKKFK